MDIGNILNILENSADDNEKYLSYLHGTNGFPSLSAIIKEEYKNTLEFDKADAVDCILTCMGYFLDDCNNCTTVQKNKIAKDFNRWLDNITYDLGLSRVSIYDTDSNPVVTDPEIEIIKYLNAHKNSIPKGITKKEIADKLGVSEKTVKDIINKLDSRYHSSSLRIAGQKVTLKINETYTTNTSNGNRFKIFSSKSTVNPLFFQLSVAQVFSLLNACKLSYYVEERNMALHSAMEIWTQLSQYTQNRIKKVYFDKDPQFKEFISIVEEELVSNDVLMYLSELEQIESSLIDLTEREVDELNEKRSL